MVLAGEFGIGKTWLADRLLTDFAHPGPVVSVIGGTGGTGGEIDVGQPTESSVPLVVVDDLHLLDDRRVRVLTQLVATGRCQLLGTLRVPCPSASLGRLRRLSGVDEFELHPLSDDELLATLSGRLPAPLAPSAGRAIATAAAGNPLYADELALGSLSAGTLAVRAGVLSFAAEPRASRLLTDLVAIRLDALPPDARDALTLLVLAGDVPAGWFADLVGLQTLRTLERERLVTWADDIVRAAHPIYREVSLPTLGEAEKRLCYARLADAALDWDGDARPALWTLRSGRPTPADALGQAVDRASDPAVASELADGAARVTGRPDDLVRAARLHSIVGNHARALQLLNEGIASATSSNDRFWLRMRLVEECWWSGDLAVASEVLMLADRDAGAEPAVLAAMASSHCALLGDVARAVPEAARVPMTGHPLARFVATITTCCAHVFGDDPAAGIAAARECIDILAGAPDLGDPGQLRTFLAFGLLADGRPAEALAEGQPAVGTQGRGWESMTAGFALRALGRDAHAALHLADAELAWTQAGVWVLAMWCTAQLARTQGTLGRHDELNATLSRLTAYPTPVPGLNAYLRDLALAWGDVARGAVSTAARRLDETATTALAKGQLAAAAESWHEAVRLGVAHRMSRSTPRPAPRGAVASTRMRLVRGILEADPAGVLAAAREFSSFGMLQDALEAREFARGLGRGRPLPRQVQAALDDLTLQDAGVRPPALTSAQPSPLTPREHEIARLATTLSSQQIADRLVVSVRTVENQLQRAYTKLGIRSRSALREALDRTK